MWLLFSAAAFGVRWLSLRNSVPFTAGASVAVSLLLAAVLLLPRAKGWGFGLTRRAWCKAGVAGLALYFCAALFARNAALRRVEEFIAQQGVLAEHYAAQPLPPWMARWSGLVRAPNGVYFAQVDMLSGRSPEFRFYADSPPNRFIARARQMPEVQAWMRFARFPVIRYAENAGKHIVELHDYRFFGRQQESDDPVTFSYRVVFAASGNVLSHGWEN
jgi:hypothetical protein